MFGGFAKLKALALCEQMRYDVHGRSAAFSARIPMPRTPACRRLPYYYRLLLRRINMQTIQKQAYQKPEMEIMLFGEDVITTSGLHEGTEFPANLTYINPFTGVFEDPGLQ